MRQVRLEVALLAWTLAIVFHVAAGQQCKICGPTEDNRRCRPDKVMDVPSNITIDDTMCTVIESTAYHLEELCNDYPGPNGYYFECVDKSNSQFSCRSTCGPSLNSIGTGPEFDLLNTGGGNLLLGKKNKDSLFDFSNFRNGGALDFQFGGVQQGRYNPSNLPGFNNISRTDNNSNGTFGSRTSSGNSKVGGFSSNAGNANIFDKDLFGTSGINNNVFTNNNANKNNINNNKNNLNGVINNGLNNNNQNVFQFKNPFPNNNYNNNLSPNQPNPFRDPFGENGKKPTPKLNTPKGNPFGGAPAFGQAPFGPSSFGNPAPLSGGKTGLGFIEPKQTFIPGAALGSKPRRASGQTEFGEDKNLGSGAINIAGLQPSQPIDLGNGADQKTTRGQSSPLGPKDNSIPGAGLEFSARPGPRFPNKNTSPQLIDRPDTAARTPTRSLDSGDDNTRGIGKQDPSALTFNVKPVVTNYPTNRDTNFDAEQAKALYPLDDSQGTTGQVGKAIVPGKTTRPNDRVGKFNTKTDYQPPTFNNKNDSPGYPATAYNARNEPLVGADSYPNQPGSRDQGGLGQYDTNPGTPSRPSSVSASAGGIGPGSGTGPQPYIPDDSPPDLNAYPGAKGASSPPPQYDYNSAGDNSNQTGAYGENSKAYNPDYRYEKPKDQARYSNGYDNAEERYPSGNLPNNAGFENPRNRDSNSNRNGNDGLRSNEVRDAIGPEGLKTKGVSPPDGLDGSRLRANKEPVGQGAEFVGTSLLADGDYLDRSSRGRAAKKQVPEEFEKPFEAQTSLFPGFDKFASGEGNSNFGTKDSVFNMFGDRSKSPPGFKDGNFNFNNPDFLRPDTYGSQNSKGNEKDGADNGRSSGEPGASPEGGGNRYNSRDNYGNNDNSNTDKYSAPQGKDRTRNQRGGPGPLQNRFENRPSSQPIFQAADRLLGKGGDSNNNYNPSNNNDRLARDNAPYPRYEPPNSNNRYQEQPQGPTQPLPYGKPNQGYYGNTPATSNQVNPNAAPYPSSGNTQAAVDPYGGVAGGSPYGPAPQAHYSSPQGNPAPQQRDRYSPYGGGNPAGPGAGVNPYFSGQQPPSTPAGQGDASRYQLPPASQLYFGNTSPQGNRNPYAAQTPSSPGGLPSPVNQPAAPYALYPDQNTGPGISSPPYRPTGQASPQGINQPYQGQSSGFNPSSGNVNPSYQTPSGSPGISNGYGLNKQLGAAPSNNVVNFRPLGPSQPSDQNSVNQGRQPSQYLGGGGGGSGSRGALQTSGRGGAQQTGPYKNSQSNIPSTVPAFTNIFGDLTSASNAPLQQASPQRGRPQAPSQSSSPFSFLTQELPNAAEKTAAFDLDNRKAFENRRTKFNTFGEGQQPGSDSLRLPDRRPEFVPGNPNQGGFPDATGRPDLYSGRPGPRPDGGDQFIGGRGPASGGGDLRGGFSPSTPVFNRFDGGGAGLSRGLPAFQQPEPGSGAGGRGYDDGRGASVYRPGQPADPRLYGSFDDGVSAGGGAAFDRQAPSLERGQPIGRQGGFGSATGNALNRFGNPYQPQPTNQGFTNGPSNPSIREAPSSNDPFNSQGGYGFEDRFTPSDDGGFQNRFSNDRFAAPDGYFGDSQFTDATTQEDTSQTSRQSDQGDYGDPGTPGQESQYYPGY